MSLLLVAGLSPVFAADTLPESDGSEAVQVPGSEGGEASVVETPDVKPKLGVSLLYFLDLQTGLTSTFERSVVTVQDGGGGPPSTTVIHVDPDLNNRKFDFEMELHGPGVQLLLPVPKFKLGRFGTGTKFFFEASSTDVSFDFKGVTESGVDITLNGTGPRFGLGFELDFGKHRNGGDLTYFFRSLPSLDMGRSPAFAPDGIQVLDDEVSLSVETHELTLRYSYSTELGIHRRRLIRYVGMRNLWTKVDIADRLRFQTESKPQFQSAELTRETAIETSSRFNGESVQAIAGFEADFSKFFSARAEVSSGKRGHGVLIQVIYSPRPRTHRPPALPRTKRHRNNVIDDILSRLERIRSEFLAAWNVCFPDAEARPAGICSKARIEDLLDKTESNIFDALKYRQLAAMLAYVRDRFDAARELLATTDLSSFQPRNPASSEAVLASLDPRHLTIARQEPSEPTGVGKIFSNVWQALGDLIQRIKDNDLQTSLCVQSSPEVKVNFLLYPLKMREIAAALGGKDPNFYSTSIESNGDGNIYRGSWIYEVTLGQHETVDCDPVTLDIEPIGKAKVVCGPPLHLMAASDLILSCTRTGDEAKSPTRTSPPQKIRWRCEVSQQPSNKEWSCKSGEH